MVNLRSLKDQNIDAFVHPKSPINEVIQTYCQEDLELPPEEKQKIKMPAHLKRLAKNIVPTFQEAVINQSKPFTDGLVNSRFTNAATPGVPAQHDRKYTSLHKNQNANMLSSPTSLDS